MTIQIYLGTEPGQWLQAEVLKCSILRRTKSPVEFHEVRIFPLFIKTRVNIGLSLYRFYVPEAQKFSGKAIYMNVQALCLGNIDDLIGLDMGSYGALARPIDAFHSARYTNVMLMDCDRLKDWNVKEWVRKIDREPSLLREYTGITPKSPIAKDFGDLTVLWNGIDPKEYPGANLIFFNDLSNLPWMQPDHPQRALYVAELNYALQNGFIPSDALEVEIRKNRLDPTHIK